MCAAAALAAAARKGSSLAGATTGAASGPLCAPVSRPGSFSSSVHASSSSASGLVTTATLAFASASFTSEAPFALVWRSRSFLASSMMAALMAAYVSFLVGSGEVVAAMNCSLRHSGKASSNGLKPESTFFRYSSRQALASSLHSLVLAITASSSRSSRRLGLAPARSSGSSDSLTSPSSGHGGSSSSEDPSRRMSEGCNDPDAPLPSLSWPLSRCGDGRRRGRVDVSFPVESRGRKYLARPNLSEPTSEKQDGSRAAGNAEGWGAVDVRRPRSDRVQTQDSRVESPGSTNASMTTSHRGGRACSGVGGVGTFRALRLVVVREK